jgi:type II secretory pathway pseudopilin PulG
MIGIMAAGIIVLIDPISQLQKANDSKRKSDLSQIKNALEIYYDDFGQYPVADTLTSDYRLSPSINGTATTLDWGSTGWQYISTLPKDPSSGRNYIYYSDPLTNQQSYYLYASLERGAEDSQACNAGSVCNNFPSTLVPTPNCGAGVICNYGTSSPNVSP